MPDRDTNRPAPEHGPLPHPLGHERAVEAADAAPGPTPARERGPGPERDTLVWQYSGYELVTVDPTNYSERRLVQRTVDIWAFVIDHAWCPELPRRWDLT